jgi:hypothetical protein
MRKYIFYILVFSFALPAIWWFFGSGYYNMHDDLQVMRVFEMEKCLIDGQIPCRWAPDMAWGYGQAMFNYYSAFPYYLGALIRIITPFSIIGTVKALFAISFVLGAYGMFLLAREFWGDWGGLLSSVLYTWAPYHALDVYVRGALAESFALAILPFLFYFFYKLITKPNLLNLSFASVTIAALLTTHNISTMIYTPITILWVLYWLVVKKDKKKLLWLASAGILGLGMAAFFVIPALFEQSLIHVDTLTRGYSNYHAHFVTLYQLFLDKSWGDGPSIFGSDENISFQIGWPHWWLGLFIGLLSVWSLIKDKRKSLNKVVLPIILLLFAGLASFLTHSRSVYVWELLPKIDFVQFPWRFLGLTIFFLSFACGALSKFKLPAKSLLIFLIALSAVLLNINYFVPVHYSREITDEQKLTGVAWQLQQKAAILDYLPKTAKIAPKSLAFSEPKIVEGNGLARNFSVKSNTFSFDAEVYSHAKFEIPVMYFPGWILIVDNERYPLEIHGDHGLIKVSLNDGTHSVEGRFTNTPVRSYSDAISVLSIVLFFGVLLVGGRKQK